MRMGASAAMDRAPREPPLDRFSSVKVPASPLTRVEPLTLLGGHSTADALRAGGKRVCGDVGDWGANGADGGELRGGCAAEARPWLAAARVTPRGMGDVAVADEEDSDSSSGSTRTDRCRDDSWSRSANGCETRSEGGVVKREIEAIAAKSRPKPEGERREEGELDTAKVREGGDFSTARHGPFEGKVDEQVAGQQRYAGEVGAGPGEKGTVWR